MAHAARLVTVKVVAGASDEEVRCKAPNRFEIHVREPALQGRANRRVQELLAGHFQVPLERVRLRKGATTPHKVFEILPPEPLPGSL